MDRLEIKRNAKEIAFQNKMFIWKPILMLMIFALGLEILEDILSISPFMDVIVILLSLLYVVVTVLFSVAYLNYVVSLTNGVKKDFIQLMKDFQTHLLELFLLMLIVGVIIFLWSLLLIIPGIIASYIYYMVFYVKAMDKSKTNSVVIKEAKELIKGYKMDFFIFHLSFIPWIILSMVSLGIALIWFVPYYTVAEALYYQKLVEIKSN